MASKKQERSCFYDVLLVDLLVSFMLWQRRAKMLYQHLIFVVKLCLAETLYLTWKICSVEIKNKGNWRTKIFFYHKFSFFIFLEIISFLEISTKINFILKFERKDNEQLWRTLIQQWTSSFVWKRLYWQLSRLSIDLSWIIVKFVTREAENNKDWIFFFFINCLFESPTRW